MNLQAIPAIVLALYAAGTEPGSPVEPLLTAEQDGRPSGIPVWLQIAGAGLTFAAVLVALFQEWIRGYVNRAQLSMVINMRPPDAQKIDADTFHPAIFVRLIVQHQKGRPAENVEVMLTKCMEYGSDGTKKVKESFLPMNLLWSHFQPPQHSVRVPSGLFRHCDLGYLAQFAGGPMFRLSTLVQSHVVGDQRVWPNVLLPGKYEIELLVSGDNAKPIRKRWTIEIDGVWDDREEVMLRDHLKINEVRRQPSSIRRPK